MQAIILAAGMGRRLRALTASNTKCMIEVNGRTLIERALSQLDALGLARIVLVVGYEGSKLVDYVSSLDLTTPVEFVENPVFDRTNNIYSLWLARHHLAEDDTLLLESDLIFEEGVLRELVDDERPTLALVDKYESWMDGTVVKIDSHDDIIAFVPGKKFRFEEIPDYYKTVNIYKFSRHFSETHYVPFLEAYVKALGENEYYEQVLRVVTHLGDSELKAKRLCGQAWYEIDDLQDLDIAESIFAESDEARVDAVTSRFGGFWRYPHLTDFCYLVNPYYPPRRLAYEMKASFDLLLTQYPSGQRVNALLVAKLLGVAQERVVVGNGAAELIRSLMGQLSGPVGIVRPTFEEYPHRLDPASTVVFEAAPPSYAYGADDLMGHFADRGLGALVLINPDNPSGNYLPKADVVRLAGWCEDQGIRLVLDESFVDFADEADASFFDDEIMDRYPHLAVVKSISKSYGVPGIRLGVVASADLGLVGALRRDVPIWNINSFGEFWLQVAEKYQRDYAEGLVRLRRARARLAEGLARIDGVRVLPSEANYLMVELTGGPSAREVTCRLLSEDAILVKDLTPKLGRDAGQYLRLAVRTEEDNDRLLAALARVMG